MSILQRSVPEDGQDDQHVADDNHDDDEDHNDDEDDGLSECVSCVMLKFWFLIHCHILFYLKKIEYNFIQITYNFSLPRSSQNCIYSIQLNIYSILVQKQLPLSKIKVYCKYKFD